MKYKILTPQEIETYNVGYAVGHRDIVITDIEWESEAESKIYRKGYMAGLMDYKRNINKVSNVSNVSNVDIETSKTLISISNSISNINNNSREYIPSLSTTHVNTFIPPTEEQVLEYARQQNDCAGMGGFACSDDDAHDFYDYYAGIGWHLPNDAHTPILDWKPFLRKWVRNPKYKKPEQETVDINDPNNFLI